MKDKFVSFLVGLIVGFILMLMMLKPMIYFYYGETVDHGCAEWVVNHDGTTTWMWKK